MSESLECFAARLVAVEEKLADLGSRLADLEIEKAVDGFLSATNDGEARRQSVTQDVQAVHPQHESQSPCLHPATYGKRNVAMLPVDPQPNQEVLEVVCRKVTALQSAEKKVTVNMRKLKDKLRLELLSELTLLIERQLSQPHDTVPNQSRASSQHTSLASQSNDAQPTGPSTDSLQSCMGLRISEAEQYMALTFSPGELGMELVGPIGRITRVMKGHQGQKKGVQPGMLMTTIDGQPYSEQLLTARISGTASYEIAFTVQA